MTVGSAAPDLPVHRLAGLDPALQHLEAALAHVDQARGQLHDARWTPGEGCRLAYRAPAEQGGHTYRDVTVSSRGWVERDYRDDPSMPGLDRAADAATVTGRLAGLAGPAATWSVEPVRYRGGSRCVLRYDARMAAGARSAYAKAFSAREFPAAARAIDTLSRVPALAGVVPHVLAVWPDLRVVVVAAVPGRSASTVLGDPALAPSAAAGLGRELGSLVAGFHRQSFASAPTATAADRICTMTAELAPTRCADAELGERCADVVDGLRRRLPRRPAEVLAHGALRTGQVVVGADGHLTVLDLDGVCRSEPGRDLGTVLAHLTWAGLRDPGLQPTLEQARAAFVSTYEEAAGPVDPASLRWWCAAGLLQVAARRYRRLETRWWPLTTGLVEAAEALVHADAPAPAGGIWPLPTSAPTHTALSDAALLDARLMTHVLDDVLVRPGRAGSRPIVQSAEQLSVAESRRTVVRYTVRGLDRSRATTVIGKAFTEPYRAHLLHEHLRVLSQGPFSEDGLRVPEPLGLLPDEGLVLYRSAPGTPLDRVADRAVVLRGLQGAGLWLARLHTSGVVLPRTWSLAQERASSRGWADVVVRASPRMADAAYRLARGWSEGLTQEGVRQVPLHKDFHPGHVLVGETICVIDLDEARQGDPAFDVAHFCAYLEAFGPYRRDARLHQAFVEQYAAASGWEPTGTVNSYAAYAWLKIARQWALGSGPCRGTGEAERRAGAARALTRGLAWLGE
jgi:Ser/Thr protein kinase RdoA (MazF antagonist)